MVFTERVSFASWESFFQDNNIIPSRIYDYSEVYKMTVKPSLLSKSIILMDDLSPYVYSKLQDYIDIIINCHVHHQNLTLFVMCQSIIKNSLSGLILKANELHISTSNQSCFKTLKYIGMYNFSPQERKLFMDALDITKCASKQSNDHYIVVNLKKDYQTMGNYTVSINKFAYLNNNKFPCTVLADEDQPWIIKLENNTINLYDFDSKDHINLSNPKEISHYFKDTSDFNTMMETNKNEFVMIPKDLYCYIVNNIKHGQTDGNGSTESDDGTHFDEKYSLLKKNIMDYITTNLNPRRVGQAKKVCNELLLNNFLSFVGVSGRTFIINDYSKISESTLIKVKKEKINPLKQKILTLDFLNEITKVNPPFLKKKNKKKKINLLYLVVIELLFVTDMPSYFVLNSSYLNVK